MSINLRAAANVLTSTVNSNLTASARICVGYGKDVAFNRTPQYAPAAPVVIQVQALSKKEIEHLDALNISNATRAAYANIQLTAVDRVEQSGGDLLDFTDPETGKPVTYLVIAVLEAWGPEWCKVALAKQRDGRNG